MTSPPNKWLLQQVIFISWEPALMNSELTGWGEEEFPKNIFTHKQWFFVILENKDITKLPSINLSLIYFWQLFGVNLLQSLNDNLWKKHVKLPRVMYLLEIKCLGTFCPQSVKEDKQFGPTTTWTARAQRAVHCQCSVHCCAGSRCTSFGVRLGPCS